MDSQLAREIRQSKPFANLEEEVFLNLLRTGDVLLRREVEVLRTEDLTFAQYNVLRILRGAGAAGASCGDIAERMVTRDPDLTRLLDRLESRGLVERARHARDRRVIIARITRSGRAVLARLDDRVAETHRTQLRHLDRSELESLLDTLVRARTPPERPAP